MRWLNNERLANRVMIALLAAIALLIGAWAANGFADRERAPALPPAADDFGPAARRAGSATDRRIAELQSQLQATPDDWAAFSQLGAAYLQKARETGDPTYYQKAEAALQETLAHEPGDYLALAAMGELALARHDFAAALDWGKRARALNADRTLAYGVIVDAQIELGRYDEAVDTLQAMVDLRPDLSSYSRVSYMRELHGDVEGAIEAMQLAVDAGGPTAENTNWTRVQLGHLYFNSGRLAEAEAAYQQALTLDPQYVHALAGLARVRAAQGDLDEAIRLYTEVVDRMPLAEYVIALGEVYNAAGRANEAQQQYELARAIDQLYRANGVNTDLELALFLADHGDPAEAVRRARESYAQRPTTFAADVLAWALYRHGAYAEAQTYAERARHLGAQDALKLFHAGMIAHQLGDAAQARAYLEQALRINPYFSLRYAPEARRVLDQLP